MMRMRTRSDLDMAITNVEVCVNRDIFLQADHATNDSGGWKFPLTEQRQLGDINLLNNDARKFVKGFEHLVHCCTLGYKEEYVNN